jgi:hypothetical protein
MKSSSVGRTVLVALLASCLGAVTAPPVHAAAAKKAAKRLPEAQQKAFEKGLTPNEARQLQGPMKKMSGDMKHLDNAVKQLRASKAIQANPKTKAAAAKFFAQHLRTAAVLDGTRKALAARDANLKSYETRLKAEFTALDKMLDALGAAMDAEKVVEAKPAVAAGARLSDALVAEYVVFDTAYDSAVADVEVEIEIYDINVEIDVVGETEVWNDEEWAEAEEQYVEVEDDEWQVDEDGGYDLEVGDEGDGGDDDGGGGEDDGGGGGEDDGGGGGEDEGGGGGEDDGGGGGE